jgi:FixJ family two-component response regulator
VLEALGRLLQFAGFNTAAFDSAATFLESFDPGSAGCLVLDFSMPGVNGLELQDTCVARGSALPIIFLTGHGDIPTSVQAMKHGAADFLTKPVDDGRAPVPPLAKNNRSRKAQKSISSCSASKLTPREREVLRHVVTGQLNKQIAPIRR